MLIWMIVAFVFILGPLLFLHELGHFWAAKRNGIPVKEFGFGLGPRIFKLFERDGTEYTIRAIPFAAFVLMAGEEEVGIEKGVMDAPRKAKFAAFAAGPAANIIATIVLLWLAYLFGPPAFHQVSIAEVDANSPAEAAGLLVNDLILQANATEIGGAGELAAFTGEHLGQTINLLIERDGQELTTELIPRKEGEYNPDIEGPIGIRMSTLNGPPDPQNVFTAGVSAAKDFWSQIEMIARFPSMVANAARMSAEKADTGEVLAPEEDIRNYRPMGIYGILQLVGFSLKTGVMKGYLFFVFQTAAMISMALGVTKLLPIPALDGGGLAFIALDWFSETVFRRRINPEKEILFHAVGLIVLLLLMVVITWQDIVNPLIEFPTPIP